MLCFFYSVAHPEVVGQWLLLQVLRLKMPATGPHSRACGDDGTYKVR
jgi:hypothetical protein